MTTNQKIPYGDLSEPYAIVPNRLHFGNGRGPSNRNIPMVTSKDILYTNEDQNENISDIVDKDDEARATEQSRTVLELVLTSAPFRGFILLLITTNAILIGLQTNEEFGRKHAYIFSLFDQLVLTVFVIEILLKWYHGFWIFWKIGWNILDFIIVAALLIGPAFQYFASGRVLRILRVLRAAKSLRSISGLQGLSLVVQTVIQSLPDMFNIALVLCIILLVFAVAGISLFAKEVPEYFGNLGAAMFALFICVTQDGWLDIHNRFQVSTEYWVPIVGTLYLVLVVTVGAFVFANLAVAAVVTNLELAMKDIALEDKEDNLAQSQEETTHVPIVPAEDGPKSGPGHHQIPTYSQNLKNLTATGLQNYLLAINALEENMQEYKRLCTDLDKIFDVVCELNMGDTAEKAMKGVESTSKVQPKKKAKHDSHFVV